MPKMSKGQAKRRIKEILQKSRNLFTAGHLSTKDMTAIEKIMKANHTRLLK